MKNGSKMAKEDDDKDWILPGKSVSPESVPVSIGAVKRWNMRKRKAPATTNGDALGCTSEDGTSIASSDKKEKIMFSVTLSKSEIEEDFLALTGRKPARRPRKRPKRIQKQLDMLFPGMGLMDVTADKYKVPELD